MYRNLVAKMPPIDIIILSRYYFTSLNFLSYSELYFWIMKYGKSFLFLMKLETKLYAYSKINFLKLLFHGNKDRNQQNFHRNARYVEITNLIQRAFP